MPLERRVVVDDPSGLHAREAARLVQAASRFRSRVTVRAGAREADARSLIGVLGLAVRPSTVIVLIADGDDADAALGAMADAINAGRPAAPPTGEVAAPDVITPGDPRGAASPERREP